MTKKSPLPKDAVEHCECHPDAARGCVDEVAACDCCKPMPGGRGKGK